MFASLLTVAVFLSPALHAVRAEFSMYVPQLAQCQNARITWNKTMAPYNLIIVPSTDPCSGDLIDDLGDHNGTSMTWKVTQPAGATLVFSLEDAQGEEAWSDEMVVQPGNDTSCLKNFIATPGSVTPANSPAPSNNSSAPAAAAAGAAALKPSTSDTLSIHHSRTNAMVATALLAAVAIVL